MRLFYNILQLVFAPLLLFLIPLFFLIRPEKSKTLAARAGLGLDSFCRHVKDRPVVWIHALSVGESTSALPLIKAVREENQAVSIVFSSTTTSGIKLANEKISHLVDSIVPFPLDILPVVTHFLNLIQPQLFILVETDFWPNFLSSLSSRKIPSILVNGRISEKSMRSYRRFSFFFQPVFDQFTELCMQTATDTGHMASLGINRSKLKTLGNLKYSPNVFTGTKITSVFKFQIPNDYLFIICGSTHPGEEEIIFTAFANLSSRHQNLFLAIAPRDISRSGEICELANKCGFKTHLFSTKSPVFTQVLIIDTIGDLASLYPVADIAFIGGSLVPEGGHNPLEAARHGLPTLFGPYMEDFSEISSELLENKAALRVADSLSLETTLENLITSRDSFKVYSDNAGICLNKHGDVISSHLAVIRKYL